MDHRRDAKYRNFEHYLTDEPAQKPKYTFQRVAQEASLLKLDIARVLDVGCAVGELIGHMSGRFPTWSFVGIDVFGKLIREAARRNPQASFHEAGFLELGSIHNASFDLITAVGVLSLFEDNDADRFWEKASALLRPGGSIVVLGPLNEFGVDLSVRHRKWLRGNRGDWESGWSIPSRQSVELSLDQHFESSSVVHYEPELDLEPAEDPVRTWTTTFPASTRARQLTNGLKLLIDYYVITAVTASDSPGRIGSEADAVPAQRRGNT